MQIQEAEQFLKDVKLNDEIHEAEQTIEHLTYIVFILIGVIAATIVAGVFKVRQAHRNEAYAERVATRLELERAALKVQVSAQQQEITRLQLVEAK